MSILWQSVAVSNPRHRRSQSAGDMWLNHQPAPKVPLNTIMQPEIKRQRSVTKLSEKDLDKASKYCLTTQQQDENGGLETRLYKVRRLKRTLDDNFGLR